MSEINKEYSELCGRIGQARYKIFKIDSDIKAMLSQVERVDVEAFERARLDEEQARKLAASVPKQEETPNE